MISNNTGVDVSAIHYPMQVACGSSYTTSFQLPDAANSFERVVHPPIGASCHVVESVQNIPLPPGEKLCPAGQVLKWLAPTYNPANVTGSGIITVTNTIKCVAGPINVQKSMCKEPMIPDSTGKTCACPQDLVLRGQTCVKSAACVQPARLNRRGECDCPKDMVLRENICVEQNRGRPDAPPKDTIRNIPGAVIPGGGADDGKSGRR